MVVKNECCKRKWTLMVRLSQCEHHTLLNWDGNSPPPPPEKNSPQTFKIFHCAKPVFQPQKPLQTQMVWRNAAHGPATLRWQILQEFIGFVFGFLSSFSGSMLFFCGVFLFCVWGRHDVCFGALESWRLYALFIIVFFCFLSLSLSLLKCPNFFVSRLRPRPVQLACQLHQTLA